MIYLILFIGLILRLINLNQSFWLDEAISALTAKAQFPFQWIGISGDFQPPLYYLFLHFFMKFNNWSEWFLRIPSVFFGVITIFIVYKFAIDLFNKKIAILSALLLSTSQFHIYYSQELRMYSLLCLLSTLSMWFFYRQKWILYILTGVIGLYTSYMFAFIFIPQFIWLTIRHRINWNLWKKWCTSLIFTSIFFIPWLPNFIKQLTTGRNVIASLPGWADLSTMPFWKLIPQLFLKFTLGRINFDNKYLYGGIFAMLVIFYGYIFWNLRRNINEKVMFVISWLISPLIFSILASFYFPIAGVWRLIFLLPPFLILTACVVSKNKYSTILVGLILLVNLFADLLYWTNQKYQRENWRDAVKYIERDSIPVVFVVENGFAPYQWYKKRDKIICGPSSIDRCLSSGRLFYVPYLQEIFNKGKTVEKLIEKNNYLLVHTENFLGVGFVHYYENSN